MKCPFCEKENDDDDIYCRFCGTKINENNQIETPIYTVNENMIDTQTIDPHVSEIDFLNNRKKGITSIIFYFIFFNLITQIFTSSVVLGIYAAIKGLAVETIDTDVLMLTQPFDYAMINVFCNVIPYVAVTILLILTCKQIIISDFKAFIKSEKIAIRLLEGFAIMFAASYISGVIVNFLLVAFKFYTIDELKDVSSENQAGINIMMSSGALPFILVFIITVFLAPFVEEMIFRKSFFSISRKKAVVAILVSGLIFGSIHVASTIIMYLINMAGPDSIYTSKDIYIELIYLIQYTVSGWALGYIYYRNKYNIWSTIFIHLAFNLLATIINLSN